MHSLSQNDSEGAMPPLLSRVLALIDKAADAGFWFGAIAIFIMIAHITVEVVSRSFFKWSTLTADEYAGYFFAGLVFLGFAWTLKVKGHIQVEGVYKRIPKAFREIGDLILYIIGFLFTAFMVWVAAWHVLTVYQMGSVAISVVRTPLFIPESLMVIGMFLFTLQFAAQACRAAWRLKRESQA